MITLGIDLAAEPAATAAWFLDWTSEGARSGRLVTHELTDEVLLALMAEADRVAIDAPFGWPDPFVDAIAGWRATGEWPGAARDLLKFRVTDKTVKGRGQNPLSVAADKIGVTAMRCSHLLHEFMRNRPGEHLNRLDGVVVEAYPAAAFRAWGINCAGYKGNKPRRMWHGAKRW